MEKQSKKWVDEFGNDIVGAILRDDFHAVNFEVDGILYWFSGWWLLDIGEDEDKVYDSKEAFLKDPIFNGNTLAEIVDKVRVEWLEVEP